MAVPVPGLSGPPASQGAGLALAGGSSSPSGPGGRTCVLRGPFERVIRDGLPAGGGAGPVVSAFELEVLGGCGGVLVVPGVGLVDRRRHDVVLLAPDEQQRSTV